MEVAVSTDEIKAYLRETHKKRGYSLDMHGIMATADLEWAKKWADFIDATYTGQRLLDRKTKEFLRIVVEAALRAEVGHIQAHVRVALKEGGHAAGDTRGAVDGHSPDGSPGLSPRRPGMGRRDRLRADPGRRRVVPTGRIIGRRGKS